MTPRDYYIQQCQTGSLIQDPEQQPALHQLQSIYHALVHEYQKRRGIRRYFRRIQCVKGLYLWGGVGIGKTVLMDCFYQSLPFKAKKRLHFYAFMQDIHTALKKHQGKKNPLDIIANELAREIIVLCFDEFFVSDITDAMLLGRLLTALFENGVCVVATSNIPPDDLYKHGLQRQQFLPAIAAIKKQMTVLHIASVVDYRLRHLKKAGVFFTPLNAESAAQMEEMFQVLRGHSSIETTPIEIMGRPLPVLKRTDQIIWFAFSDICRVPRSQNDYLAIAKTYQTVLISDVPRIPSHSTDTIILFITLIDVLYDAHRRLIMSADEPVANIYARGIMINEYTRTHSRLLEMQSSEYFVNDFWAR